MKKGTELFVLQSDEIRSWDTQLRTLTEDLHSKEESLRKSDAAYEAQLEIKDAEIAQAKSEVEFRERTRRQVASSSIAMETLAKNGGISQVELIETASSIWPHRKKI